MHCFARGRAARGRPRPARRSGGSVDLVAYSTPKDAYAKIIPAFQKTAGRERRELHPVLRRLRRPGAGGRRPACRPTSSRSRSSPTSTTLVKKGLVPQELEREPLQGHRHRLGRRLRRARRQPEAHHGLGRPDQARRPGDHAEPVHLRRRALERDGRLRRAARARARPTSRRSTTSTSSSSTSPCSRTSARDALNDLRAGQGRRPAHLRERGDLRASRRACTREYNDARRRRILIETPVALTKSGLKKPAAKAFVKYLWSPTAQKRVRASRATGRSSRASRRAPSFYGAARPLHDRTSKPRPAGRR